MNTLYKKITQTSNNKGLNKVKFLHKYKQFMQSNSIIAKLAFLLLVIIIFIILLRIGITILAAIFSNDPNPSLINGMIDAEQLTILEQDPNNSSSIPILRSKDEVTGLEFTWSVWIWIKNPPILNPQETQYKHVFNKGNRTIDSDGLVTPNNAPGLYINSKYDSLVVIMNTFDEIQNKITVENIPIEKWINVIIRCKQTQVDVFINGTLTKSSTLLSIPKQNYDNVNLSLNGGFSGNTSALHYFSYAIGANEIQNLVDKGPNTKIVGENITKAIPYYLSFRWFFPEQVTDIS